MFDPATIVNRSINRSSRPSSTASRQHDVFANEHFGFDQGKLQRGEAGPGLDRGTIKEQKTSPLREIRHRPDQAAEA